MLQVLFSGTHNALLFLRGDAFQSAAIKIIFPESDFYEYQGLTFLHDEVNFTTVAVIVSGYQLESLLPEKFTARILCVLTLAITSLAQWLYRFQVQ